MWKAILEEEVQYYYILLSKYQVIIKLNRTLSQEMCGHLGICIPELTKTLI